MSPVRPWPSGDSLFPVGSRADSLSGGVAFLNTNPSATLVGAADNLFFGRDSIEDEVAAEASREEGDSVGRATGRLLRPCQLNLSLDRWPVPQADGVYDARAAHRQAFEQRTQDGRVVIELWVLEVIPDLYIQACAVQLGENRRDTLLRLNARNRFQTPEAALRAAAQKAARELKAVRRAAGLHPESKTVLLRAANWLDDILQHCDYVLERQVKLFG